MMSKVWHKFLHYANFYMFFILWLEKYLAIICTLFRTKELLVGACLIYITSDLTQDLVKSVP